ncbi:MAG: hypothetical protein A2Z14_01130 [Chloroflexi bacterium RBG_16_48_8]|nr:MAG: hypothetical protein A2Z14_01130 [Chloroflexi bacterium RBG_16_48_8]
MDSYQSTSNAQPSESNPAFSAGLEAGLVGAVLILIEQLLQNFLDFGTLGWILGLFRVIIWVSVGALSVYWLKGKGSIERSDQTKAGIIAGFLTGLVTGVLLVLFAYVQSKSIEDLPIPAGIPVETFNEIFNQVFGVSLICCYGLPSFLIATAFSFGGSLLMRVFIGEPVQGSLDQQKPYQGYPQFDRPSQAFPQQEAPPKKLDAFLSREGLPIELHPSVAAYRRGEIADARPAFVRYLRQNPKHAYAWLWLAVMIDDPDRQVECVKRALALEPGNETARKMLAFLERSSSYG